MNNQILRTYRTYLSATALLFGLMFNPAISLADDAGKACGNDYKKYCSHVKKGDGRIGKCLMSHKNDLSQSCRIFFQQATKKILNEFVAACQTEVAKNCKGVQPGGGRILNCLREYPETVSDGCKNVLKKL